jgi:hypothetical protein
MVDRSKSFEQEIQSAANDFTYPVTPQIAEAVMLRLKPKMQTYRLPGRRLVWALVILAVCITGLMQVPPVRAAVLEWIQIGVVRIFRPFQNPSPSGRPEGQPQLGITPVTATANARSEVPSATPASLPLPDLAGETTLDEAQRQLSFPILVPSQPEGLGLPERVYLQDQGGSMLVLVWLDPKDPKRVRLSLHTLTPGSWGIEKTSPKVVQETRVNGQPAVWTEGPYFLKLRNQDFELLRLIEGNVLIWTQNGLTYRLETDQSLEQAILMAESLGPIPPRP